MYGCNRIKEPPHEVLIEGVSPFRGRFIIREMKFLPDDERTILSRLTRHLPAYRVEVASVLPGHTRY